MSLSRETDFTGARSWKENFGIPDHRGYSPKWKFLALLLVAEISLACVLNPIILICYYACSLMYLERLFCFRYQA